MGFMGMVFAGLFLIIIIVYLFLTGLYYILALVLKLVGKHKDNDKLRKAGTVFLVLGIVFTMPLLLGGGYLAVRSSFWEVTLPDGKTAYVSSKTVGEMQRYAEYPDDAALDALDVLLTRHQELVYYHDNNRAGLLDWGIEAGNAELVQLALAHGALPDNPERYGHMSYVSGSLDSFLDVCNGRSVTEDDIAIARMLFGKNAVRTVKNQGGAYSNLYGKAVWAVLYNDQAVTDTELALLQLFAEQGISSDPELDCSSLSDNPAARDANYDKLMRTIGMPG